MLKLKGVSLVRRCVEGVKTLTAEVRRIFPADSALDAASGFVLGRR